MEPIQTETAAMEDVKEVKKEQSVPLLPGVKYPTHNLVFPQVVNWGALDPSAEICVINKDPAMYLLEFLKPGEAEMLIDMSRPILRRKKIGRPDERTENEYCVASSAVIKKQDISEIINRVAKLINFPEAHIEDVVVTHYTAGQGHAEHTDFLPGDVRTVEDWGGQRLITLLVYLNTIPLEQGGRTMFTHTLIGVSPVKNAGLLWFNIDQNGNPDWRTLHRTENFTGEERWVALFSIKEVPPKKFAHENLDYYSGQPVTELPGGLNSYPQWKQFIAEGLKQENVAPENQEHQTA